MMNEKLTGENGELIFADEYPMENMYYILYYNFIDASKKHFMWRQMPLFALFDEHTSEEIACLCLSLIKSVAKKEDKTGLEFLDSYEFPKEVQSAVEKLREAFQHPESVGDTLTATCSICGKSEDYKMDIDETNTYMEYQIQGRAMGYIQNLFPKIPAWIRSGAIDQFSGGFCICPACCDAAEPGEV